MSSLNQAKRRWRAKKYSDKNFLAWKKDSANRIYKITISLLIGVICALFHHSESLIVNNNASLFFTIIGIVVGMSITIFTTLVQSKYKDSVKEGFLYYSKILWVSICVITIIVINLIIDLNEYKDLFMLINCFYVFTIIEIIWLFKEAFIFLSDKTEGRRKTAWFLLKKNYNYDDKRIFMKDFVIEHNTDSKKVPIKIPEEMRSMNIRPSVLKLSLKLSGQSGQEFTKILRKKKNYATIAFAHKSLSLKQKLAKILVFLSFKPIKLIQGKPEDWTTSIKSKNWNQLSNNLIISFWEESEKIFVRKTIEESSEDLKTFLYMIIVSEQIMHKKSAHRLREKFRVKYTDDTIQSIKNIIFEKNKFETSLRLLQGLLSLMPKELVPKYMKINFHIWKSLLEIAHSVEATKGEIAINLFADNLKKGKLFTDNEENFTLFIKHIVTLVKTAASMGNMHAANTMTKVLCDLLDSISKELTPKYIETYSSIWNELLTSECNYGDIEGKIAINLFVNNLKNIKHYVRNQETGKLFFKHMRDLMQEAINMKNMYAANIIKNILSNINKNIQYELNKFKKI